MEDKKEIMNDEENVDYLLQRAKRILNANPVLIEECPVHKSLVFKI